VLVVAALHFTRAILLPFAVAVLLSFILVPVAARLERLRIGRAGAVAVTVLLGLGIALSAAFVVVRQAADLARELPKYEQTLRTRVRMLRGVGGEALSEAAETVENLEKELSEAETGEKKKTTPQQSVIRGLVFGNGPIPVEVVDTAPLPVRVARKWLTGALAPVGSAALVVLFATFMLIYREDMRDRLMRLVGRDHVCAATEAVGDAGRRVSRYLSVQVCINTIHGTAVGLGLWASGLPNAFLWGLLAGMLRFIPYLGPWMGAAAPILLSLAVFESWVIPLWTIGLFITLELIVNNVLEPLLYGSSTGVTPMAVILSAVFWAWLWGPVGLILATPLPVCLTAIAKHVPQLAFLNTSLATGTAVPPDRRFYQRLLSYDAHGARKVVRERLRADPAEKVEETFESVVFPALVMAENDRRAGRLDEERSRFLAESVVGIFAEFSPGSRGARRAPYPAGSRGHPLKVLCAGTENEAARTAASLLGQWLAARGHVAASSRESADVQGVLEAVARTRVDCLAIVSVASGAGAVKARDLCREVRGRFPGLSIVVSFWHGCRSEKLRETLFSAGADVVATSFAESSEGIERIARELRRNSSMAEKQEASDVREERLVAAGVYDEGVYHE